MPLVAPEEEQPLGTVAQIQEPDAVPQASVMGTLGAATRLSNITGSLFDRLNHPAPDAKAVPGFDPLSSIPSGYEQYADKFLDAHSPEEMEWTKNRLNDELEDKKTIERAGKLGFVASMAAGLTDPLTLASMLIPGGGETRLVQAGRMATMNAGTAAAQEGLQHELSLTRTPGESVFNIAGSAVMGGILGAAIRPHVPARVARSVGDDLTRELHTADGGEKVLGPEQRSVLDTALPSDMPESFFRGPETERGEPVEAAAAAPAEEARVSGFKTAKGSEYVVNADGTTTRNKAARPEHPGESGPQPTSEATHYVSEDDVEKLSEFQAQGGPRKAVALLEDGRIGIKYLDGPDAGMFEKRTVVPTEDGPDVGRTPVELWKDGERVHFGNPITEVTHEAPAEASAQSPMAEAGFQPATAQDRAAHTAEAQKPLAQRLKEQAGLSANSPAAEPVTSETHINPGDESTSGAAAVAKPDMGGEQIARGARTLAKSWVGKVAPGLRLLNSPSMAVRRLVQELANTPEMLEKNYSGIATPQPIERALWRQEGTWWSAWKDRSELFRAYKERMSAAGEDAMSRSEFGEEVSHAMRRGDEHAVPEVAQAAKKTRATVFEPLKARAMKLGLLPEDVKATGADSYLTRQYDARKIRSNLGNWLDTLAEGFKAQGAEPGEALDIAHKVTRNVLGSERGTMDWHIMDDIVPASGRMKERTLNLPDTLLEPYLNSDIDHLSHSYLRSMAPEVEMTERFGSRDMQDQLDEVKDEYARLMEQSKARGEGNGALEDLNNRRDADIRDLSAIRDRLYGIYGQPKDPGSFAVRAGKLLRSDNALRLLGAATLAHFPDLANVIVRYGMPNTFGAIGRMLSSSSALNLTRSEAKRMGAALDMTMNVTASILGDYASHSQFAEQRVMAKLTRGFTIATGETPLITAVQALTSTLAQHEILTTAEKLAAGGAIPANQSARLAAAGLDEPMLQRIAKQGGQFAREANGLRFGMSDTWKDQKAAAAFESAVLREAHGVTLRPGAGDTPLFMSGELGKTILQFKTFAFAANRIIVNPLMQGLAHGDIRAIQGLFALATMGTASYVAKQTAAGQPVELDKPGRLAMEVADKSNLLGWTGEVVFPGLWQLGMKDLSRWSDRDATETLLGPSAGTIATAYGRRLPSKLTAQDGEKGFQRSDLHFLRRLMPGQNLWYFRRGVNAMEDAVGNAFDLPGESNADRAAKVKE